MKKQARNLQQPKSDKTPVNVETPKATDVVSWRFSSCDKKRWSLLNSDHISHDDVVETIIPFLMQTEGQSWSYWLTDRKKKCHEILVSDLNKCARDRLDKMHVETEKIMGIHLGNKKCLYGYLISGVCYILWYDSDHGDNDSCVCPSYKKGDKKKHQRR
mgnify:CR=1 FL=1